MSELKWHRAGSLSEINQDQPLSVNIEGNQIGIYQVDNQYYALEDVCPHAYAILTEGFVDGCEIECPLHAAVFDITNGKLQDGPADRDLQTYPVKVEGEDLMVQA